MKYSTRLSDAVHILAFIALNPNGSLSSSSIAESIHTNPGCVRQLMSALRRAGLISSVKGHPRPALTRIPALITLLDVYRAVEGEKPLLHLDTHTNPECGAGIYIQLSLRDFGSCSLFPKRGCFCFPFHRLRFGASFALPVACYLISPFRLS